MRTERWYCPNCCLFEPTRRVEAAGSTRIECAKCDWLLREIVLVLAPASAVGSGGRSAIVPTAERRASLAFAAQWFARMHEEVAHAH